MRRDPGGIGMSEETTQEGGRRTRPGDGSLPLRCFFLFRVKLERRRNQLSLHMGRACPARALDGLPGPINQRSPKKFFFSRVRQ